MPTGMVKWFNGPSGHGVITVDMDGAELFVHRGSILLTGAALFAGDRVEFDIQDGGMGSQAVDVRGIGGH